MNTSVDPAPDRADAEQWLRDLRATFLPAETDRNFVAHLCMLHFEQGKPLDKMADYEYQRLEALIEANS